MNKSEKRRAYYIKNQDVLKAKAIAYRKANPEKVKEWRKKWNTNNPEKLKIMRRNIWIRKKYGVTAQRYEEMVKSQNGVCYICSKSNKLKRLAVDHNHSTGEVRALLCNKCNVVLAHSGEDVIILYKCIEYIRKFNVTPDGVRK